jgi:uncharacterized membrane protein
MESLITFLIVIVGWIIVGIRLMRLCDNSGVSLGWFAFVPFLNFTRWARLAGSSPWLVLLWIIPIVGLILALVWLYRIATHTQTMQWFWIYVLAWIAAIVVSALSMGGTVTVIVGIVITIVEIAAMWTIFDPTKPIRRGEAATA